jgi:hypothetical protein
MPPALFALGILEIGSSHFMFLTIAGMSGLGHHALLFYVGVSQMFLPSLAWNPNPLALSSLPYNMG